jgi:methionyl-tRNA synthetase
VDPKVFCDKGADIFKVRIPNHSASSRSETTYAW